MVIGITQIPLKEGVQGALVSNLSRSGFDIRQLSSKTLRAPTFGGGCGIRIVPYWYKILLKISQSVTESKIVPILKLPRFLPHRLGGEKERQFQNWNYF